MSLSFFLVSVVGLLLTPGPTNTLLAVAAASNGFRRALRLLPAELGAYLMVVVPVTLVAGPWLDARPAAMSAVTAAAGLWVAFLAVKLWRLPQASEGQGAAAVVAFRDVFVTTLLNPKALVIGLALMPRGTPGALLPWFGTLAAAICSVAVLWLLLGATLSRGRGLPPALRRGAAGYLGIVAIGLVARSL
ncbi:hypothetical protein [Halodurantibacterium flavum]|uniref:Threonine/homoserine/homoserine lactone efflux protein n=1 Tax=Halodurantibacterium flavum TaxID=1382802 RepID=A0ABW4S654_9RHOB